MLLKYPQFAEKSVNIKFNHFISSTSFGDGHVMSFASGCRELKRDVIILHFDASIYLLARG